MRRTTSIEEAARVWRRFKATGERKWRNALMVMYFPIVKYNAERIGAKLPDEVDRDDLVSAGVFGLIDAIKAFDLDRGVKFETYCAPRIRGAILDELRTTNPVTTTLSRSIFALFIFFLLGLVLGTAAEVVVKEHEHSREAEILKRYREEPKQADEDPASGSSTDDDQENLVVSSA